MGWVPSEYHGGIAGILASRRFPKTYCIRDSVYDEQLDEHITGWKHKQKVLKSASFEECGDTIRGGRMETAKPKGTLTFEMGTTRKDSTGEQKCQRN
jgi:hypothetical protein